MSWVDFRDGNNEIYFTLIEIDEDGDGLPPRQEAILGTDPNLYDTDGDGMPDGWEANYSSCVNPLAGDSLADGDTDGLTNLEEYNPRQKRSH